MRDHDRVAEIIRFLDARHAEQPDLAAVAAHVGLSPYHVHRLFARWAGVTPKAFLRCVSATHARRLLREGRRVLDATLDLGLSSPGRLHDLCVHLEGASPGEVASGGADWTLAWGLAESPFGTVALAEGPRGICHVSFVVSGMADEAEQEIRAAWPGATLRRSDERVRATAERIFPPPDGVSLDVERPLRAVVRGTALQLQVWRALLAVPEGQLVSYGDLAAHVGRPRAARAVGSAVGANPLAYLIPCHRVLRATGALGGYRWGMERKRLMLACEAARRATRGGLSAHA